MKTVKKQGFQVKMQNLFYYLTGVVFLFLAKVKNYLKGYSTPKRIPIQAFNQCVEYDVHVVEEWLKHLQKYSGVENYIAGKNILELGPGSDLGIGLYLLYKGALKYNAIDVNNLIKDVPDDFYETLFKILKNHEGTREISSLRTELEKTRQGKNDKLNYICRDDFNIESAFGKESVDLIFSQAAFEHFDDVQNTVRQLSLASKSGAVITMEIDFQTHSRWIRELDPNNIYRYPSWLYNLFYFRGIPNRVRPYQYKKYFEECGWKNIVITPLSTLSEVNCDKIKYSLTREFQDERNQMEYLSVILCATKA